MFQWCSFCQKFISETEPIENLSITHGICTDCREKIKTEPILSQVKSTTQFFNELKTYADNFNKIDLTSTIQKAKSLGVNPSDFFIGILQPLIAKITEKSSAAPKEKSLDFNNTTSIVTSKILELYELELKNSTDIICASSIHSYSFASIRYFKVLLRQENFSTHLLSSTIDEDFVTEIEKISPKVLIFSVWDTEDIQKVQRYISRFTEEKNPPLVVFDFAEKRPLDLPSFAISFNGNNSDMIDKIRNRLNQ